MNRESIKTIALILSALIILGYGGYKLYNYEHDKIFVQGAQAGALQAIASQNQQSNYLFLNQSGGIKAIPLSKQCIDDLVTEINK